MDRLFEFLGDVAMVKHKLALKNEFFGKSIGYPREVLREDGSGHCWIVNATVQPTGAVHLKRYRHVLSNIFSLDL
jgi:hypothetical protein